MSSHSNEQFIRFTTDAVALERTFRFLQSITIILTSSPRNLAILQQILSLINTTTTTSAAAYKGSPSPTSPSPSPSPSAATTTQSTAQLLKTLIPLRQRLGHARRLLRLPRFIESLSGAQRLLHRARARPAEATTSLDAGARSLHSMYLLLDAAATAADLLDPAAPTDRPLALHAQRFWLLALACAVLSGLVKTTAPLYRGRHRRSSPPPPPPPPPRSCPPPPALPRQPGKHQRPREEYAPRPASPRPRPRPRCRIAGHDAESRHRLLRGLVANALDMVLPGTALGWIRVEAGTVGWVMLLTTVLTGIDVWERCGREAAALLAAAADGGDGVSREQRRHTTGPSAGSGTESLAAG